jgi:flagellar protein FliS
MNAPNPYAKQYQKVAAASQNMDVNPHKQIELLLDGAIHRLRLAQLCTEKDDRAGKAKAASDAAMIIDALSACLDLQQGGQLAEQLAALYAYATRRVAESNARHDAAGFAEVAGLLEDVAGAWKEIRPS